MLMMMMVVVMVGWCMIVVADCDYGEDGNGSDCGVGGVGDVVVRLW